MGDLVMRTVLVATIALSASVGGAQFAHADESMPWVFNAPAADGYSITLAAVDPAPGTPLVRGSEVTVTVSVTYVMSVAPHGFIVLVPQDEKNRRVSPGDPQVKQEVSGPSGAATLTQRLIIPRDAKEVRLFVPLVPDGLTNTTGEITIPYPVVKTK